MPGPIAELAPTALNQTLGFSIEPALNAFNSLSLLNKADYLYGLDEWVARTLAAMSPDELHRHRLVFWGLYYAIEPKRSYPTFSAYLTDLERQTPETLRQRVFDAYARFPVLAAVREDASHVPAPTDVPSLLADGATYLKYLGERFKRDFYDDAVELESHQWLNRPADMKELLITHMRGVWASYMEPEWERVWRLLQDCVDAYRQINFGGLSNLQAMEQVVGREVDEHWRQILERANRVVFVPSAHVGPYQMKIETDEALYVVFGARQPRGVPGGSSDLSRSELLVRLMTLADDTRLRMLHLLAQRGEMCSPDIIRELNLSQSAASRHLQQLSATGYLSERRREGAKCFSLNADQIDDTFGALTKFLQHKNA